MNANVTKFIKQIVPLAIRVELQRFSAKEEYQRNKKRYIEAKRITDFLKTELKKNDDPEKRQVFKFLKKRLCVFFPYDFIDKYDEKNIEVHLDSNCKMNYVLYKNKRIYFPRNMEVGKIRGLYNSLLEEQDINSPHCYQIENFQVKEDDIVADVGAAEGLFSLMIIDKAKEIHLFECEPHWIEALEKTFEPWKEKVKITNKYVSDISNKTNVTLDEYFGEKEVNFIKADIEGAELSMLKGATSILQRKNLKLVLCTYHKQNEAEELNEELSKNGFATEFSKGYMLFHLYDELMPPYLRRGLIRATK